MKHCLIVDDSRVIRKVARRIIEDLNLKADEAEDGQSALDSCKRAMPDAILLDSSLPNISGVEFLRALRREQNGTKPLVVYCTIENDVSQITEAIGAGADEYILKPYDRAAVEAKFAEAGLL